MTSFFKFWPIYDVILTFWPIDDVNFHILTHYDVIIQELQHRVDRERATRLQTFSQPMTYSQFSPMKTLPHSLHNTSVSAPMTSTRRGSNPSAQGVYR